MHTTSRFIRLTPEFIRAKALGVVRRELHYNPSVADDTLGQLAFKAIYGRPAKAGEEDGRRMATIRYAVTR